MAFDHSRSRPARDHFYPSGWIPIEHFPIATVRCLPRRMPDIFAQPSSPLWLAIFLVSGRFTDTNGFFIFMPDAFLILMRGSAPQRSAFLRAINSGRTPRCQAPFRLAARGANSQIESQEIFLDSIPYRLLSDIFCPPVTSMQPKKESQAFRDTAHAKDAKSKSHLSKVTLQLHLDLGALILSPTDRPVNREKLRGFTHCDAISPPQLHYVSTRDRLFLPDSSSESSALVYGNGLR
ncbi:uncharacterized protein CLUP02_08254 [Colletotrichum lupini]|uniref:Uncharacterized protein n=1 Tax=Colletotrichum lupini TaxID=145971 RepID=A0A9Q8WGR1_9PEZI|nr:uncharacterized protein CLUP02_08254 [Colletotrichum lupini]UQC82764.1 hypothetical protein CLUP02_08254 [Colletotrichum lupini]